MLEDARGPQPMRGSERELLEQWLDFQRATLALKCRGLTPEQLSQQAAPPSTLSLARLLRHLADMEHMDALILRGQEPVSIYQGAGDAAAEDSDPDGGMYDWSLYDVDDDPLDAWSAACARSREVMAEYPSVDATAPGDFSALSLRALMLALTMEYARHTGHADMIRERLDGQVGY